MHYIVLNETWNYSQKSPNGLVYLNNSTHSRSVKRKMLKKILLSCLIQEFWATLACVEHNRKFHWAIIIAVLVIYPPLEGVAFIYSYLLGHVLPLHKVHLEVLFWATLTKWDVNSSDYNPYGVGDCFSNLSGESSTFFFFQLLLQ